MNKALISVLMARQHQLDLGYTPEHDDKYMHEELEEAAVAYAMADTQKKRLVPWPWSWKHWKPKSKRENLVRACALLLAAIERHDRAVARQQNG